MRRLARLAEHLEGSLRGGFILRLDEEQVPPCENRLMTYVCCSGPVHVEEDVPVAWAVWALTRAAAWTSVATGFVRPGSDGKKRWSMYWFVL